MVEAALQLHECADHMTKASCKCFIVLLGQSAVKNRELLQSFSKICADECQIPQPDMLPRVPCPLAEL